MDRLNQMKLNNFKRGGGEAPAKASSLSAASGQGIGASCGGNYVK